MLYLNPQCSDHTLLQSYTFPFVFSNTNHLRIRNQCVSDSHRKIYRGYIFELFSNDLIYFEIRKIYLIEEKV